MPDDLDSIIAAAPSAGKGRQSQSSTTDLDSLIASAPPLTPKKVANPKYTNPTSMGQRVKNALVGPGSYAANAPKQTPSDIALRAVVPGYDVYKTLTGPAGGKPIVDASALQLEKSTMLANSPRLRGVVEAGESFAGELTTPRSVGMLAGLEELKLAGSAVSLLKNPVVKRTLMGASAGVNLYLTYQMAHGMGDRGKAALEAYNKHDYETMARELGTAGVDAMFAALGIRNLAKTAILTDPLKPGMAKDLGGKPGPEVLPNQPEVTSPEKSPEAKERAVQRGQRDPLARQRGETPAEWKKRTAGVQNGQPKETPEQEIARLKAENAKMAGNAPAPVKTPAKAQAGAVGVSQQKEKPEPPSHPAVLQSKPVVAGQPKEAPVPVKATNSELLAKKQATDTAAKAAIPQPTAVPNPTAKDIVKLETELGHRPSSTEVQRHLRAGYGAATRAIEEAYKQPETVATETKPPVAESTTPPTETSAPVAEAKPSTLPANLSGAKPRYSYGKKQFDLEFESDLDKARYIAARPNRSKADQAYVDFVKKETGLDESAIRSQGNDIRSAIKSVAKDAEPGKLTVPKDVWRKTTKEVVVPTETKPAEPEKKSEVEPVKVEESKSTPETKEPTVDPVKAEIDRPKKENARLSKPIERKGIPIAKDSREGPIKEPEVLPTDERTARLKKFEDLGKAMGKGEISINEGFDLVRKKFAKEWDELDQKNKDRWNEVREKHGIPTRDTGDAIDVKSEPVRNMLPAAENPKPAKDDSITKRDVPKPLNLRQKLKGASPAVEPTAPVKAPESKPALPESSPEAMGAVNTIFGTGKNGGLEKVKLQPVDAEGKPTGQGVEMDLAAEPQQEVARVASQLGKDVRNLTIEPIGANPNELRKWFRVIEPPKRAESEVPQRSGPQKEPEPGGDVRSSRAIKGYKAGTRFTYLEKVPEGHVVMSPTGDTVIVSSKDFSTFREAPDQSGERGSLSLRSTPSLPDEPEKYYSKPGLENKLFPWYRAKIKNSVVRALSQTEVASPDVHAALVKTENSRAQSAAAMHAYVPRIIEALGKGPNAVSWDTFRQALVENVLRGKEDMWNHMVDMSLAATNEQLEKDMKEYVISMLQKAHFDGGEPANVVTSLLDRKDFDGLRDVLAHTFAKAADSVASVMPPDEYDKTVNSDSFKRALPVYKNTLEKSFRENHLSNEGVLSDWLGDLDTYIPLIPITDAEARAAVGGVSRVAFNKPTNTANRMAGGLADSYSSQVSDIAKRFASTHYQNNRAAARQLAEDVGLLQQADKDSPEPDWVWFNGRRFVPTKVQVTNDLDIPMKQGMKHIPGQYMLTPEWFHNEAIQLLSRDAKIAELYNPNNIIAKITKAALIGPTDVVVHGSNLVGVLAARTPFMGDSLTGRVVGAFPFVKRAAATYNVIKNGINGVASTLEAADDIMEMAEYGGISEKFGSETYSPEYAAMTGAKLVGPIHGKGIDRVSMAPLLYGPNGADINARLLIHRAMKKMMPDATQTERYLAVNQLGNYTRSLQGSWERALKSTMLSPFATAGMTMNRNGVNTLLGTGPQIGGEKSWFEQHITFNSALITTVTWALAHKAYRGKWPWEEVDSKLLKIRVKPEHQDTAIGRALCGGSSKNGSCYLDVGLSNPIVGRGLRQTGLQGAYDTAMAGGSSDQVADALTAQALSTALSPVMGPPAKLLFLGLGGVEPTITGWKNPAGQNSPQFFPATLPQKHGMAGWGKQHVIAPLIGMNSLMTNVGAATGWTDGILRESPHGTLPERWGHLGFNLIVPNVTSMSHPEAHHKFLANQRKAEDNAARKRDLPQPAHN